jgi:predicted phosphodiesterase
MRIACLTDLHIDYGPLNKQVLPYLAARIERAAPDAVAVAGDIATDLDILTISLKAISGLATTNVFVPGNHDVWCRVGEGPKKPGCSMRRYKQDIKEACERAGFHYLPNQPLIVDGVGFAGTMGWYDYSFRRPDLDERISLDDYRSKRCGSNVWYDIVCADLGAPDEEVAARMERELAHDIGLLAKENVRGIVCVTHHVPFRRCVEYKNFVGWDFFSAYMGSEGLGRIVLEQPLVRAALFGHTHSRFDVRIDHVRCVCPPVGYLRKRTPLEDLAERSVAVVEV